MSKVQELLEDVSYKFRMKRDVYVDSIQFKIYSANPRKLDLRGERLLTEIIRNIKGNDVVFDIGANIGLYSIALAKYQPTAKIYAFEPNPETCLKLNANLKLNKVKTVSLQQTAIGNMDGTSTFIISSENARSSFYQFNASFGGAKAKKTIQVDVRTLDGLNLPVPQHIKIDAEGSEPIILEGALDTLQKHKPVVYIEPHGEKDEAKINEILQKVNYNVVREQNCFICYPN